MNNRGPNKDWSKELHALRLKIAEYEARLI